MPDEDRKAKKEPHVGMRTVVFTCAKGDTVRVHGHSHHQAHHGHVAKKRRELARGCPVMKLRPGSTKKVRCGAKIVETTIEHEPEVLVVMPPAEAEAPAEAPAAVPEG